MEASINNNRKSLWIIRDYSEPSETSKTELFAKIVDCIQEPLTISAEHFILGVSQGYEYTSDNTKQNPGSLFFFPANLFLNSILSSHYYLVKRHYKSQI